jgi:hypothetical protein
MSATVAIHQPNYLPWIGLFHKIYTSDKFVFLDNVEYTAGSWFNRNKIKTNHGWMWLTVPVHSNHEEEIQDATIDTSKRWQKKHKKSITIQYTNAEYSDELDTFLDTIYEDDWENMSTLNMQIIKELSDEIGLETEFIRASDLGVTGSSTELLIDICEKTNSDTYFSGQGGKDYMEEELFGQNGIELIYQNVDYPEYEQCHGEFIPKLSIIDTILNIGIEGTYTELEKIDAAHPQPETGSGPQKNIAGFDDHE